MFNTVFIDFFHYDLVISLNNTWFKVLYEFYKYGNRLHMHRFWCRCCFTKFKFNISHISPQQKVKQKQNQGSWPVGCPYVPLELHSWLSPVTSAHPYHFFSPKVSGAAYIWIFKELLWSAGFKKPMNWKNVELKWHVLFNTTWLEYYMNLDPTRVFYCTRKFKNILKQGWNEMKFPYKLACKGILCSNFKIPWS